MGDISSPCPACGQALQPAHTGEIALLGCHACGGAWLHQADLQRLAERHPETLGGLDGTLPARRQAAPTPAGQARSCPQCGVALAPLHCPGAPEVHLDGCRKCGGVWFDHGELTASAAALQHRQAAPAPAGPHAATDSGCPYCQGAILADATFCPHCVASLTDPFEPLPPVSIEDPPRPYGLAAVCVACLVMAGVIAWAAHVFQSRSVWYLLVPVLALAAGAAVVACRPPTRSPLVTFARQRRFSLTFQAGTSVPARLAQFALLFREWGHGRQRALTSDVLSRRTSREELLAFSEVLTRGQFVGTGGSLVVAVGVGYRGADISWRRVAAILRQDIRLPSVVVRPAVSAQVVEAAKRLWNPAAGHADDDFERLFRVETDDAGFCDRLFTPALRAHLAARCDLAVELQPGGVVVLPWGLTRGPYRRLGPDQYLRLMLTAREVMEAAKQAAGG